MRINGKKVVDALRKLPITINSQDAKRGKNKNPSGCAAALAIVRGLKTTGVTGARVHLGRVYVEYPDKWVRYKTPASLKAEIVSFDRGNTAEFMEGNYGLLPMPPADRLGVRRKTPGPEKSRHKSRKERRKIARIHHQIEGVRAHGANR